MKTVTFRQSCIFGTRQFGIEDQGWIAWFCLAATRGQPFTIFGDGRQIRDTLWVDDLIDAYQLALGRIDRIKGEVFNIGGGPANTLSLLELVDALSRHFGRDLDPSFDAWRPGDQRVFVADIRKAERLLGWKPRVATAEGVARLLEWVDGNRKLFTVRTDPAHPSLPVEPRHRPASTTRATARPGTLGRLGNDVPEVCETGEN